MYVRLRRPPEPEQTGGHECDGEQGRDQSVFLRSEAVLLDVRLEVKVDVGDVDDDSDDTSNHDIGEDDSQFANVEPVDADVDKGESFEEGIIDSYSETHISGENVGWE